GNSLSAAVRTSRTSLARRRSSPNYSRATKRRIEKRLFSARAEKTLGANGAEGISDIEGKVARVATSELGNERVSNSTSARSTMPCSSSARYRCPLSRRASIASSLKTARALTRIWSEQVRALYASNGWTSPTSAIMKDADMALSFVARRRARQFGLRPQNDFSVCVPARRELMRLLHFRERQHRCHADFQFSALE